MGEIFSHPNKKLVEHLNNTYEIGINILKGKKGLTFNLITHKEIEKIVKYALQFHDIGKATYYFQQYLKASIENKALEFSKEYTKHSLLSAIISFFNIKKKQININKEIISLLTFILIKQHHGNLENIDDMLTVSKQKWRIIEDQLKNISVEFQDKIQGLNIDAIKEEIDDLLFEFNEYLNMETIETYFLINFLFSILIYSDKTEVILNKKINTNSIKNLDTLIDNYKNLKFMKIEKNTLNLLREEAYNIAYSNLNKNISNGRIFTLNLPTGMGKTLTVLNLALKLIKEDNDLSRIIYAMPFTSIIDQSAKTIEEIFKFNDLDYEDKVTVHHHLSEVKIKIDDGYLEGDKAQFLIENWDKPIILTTFWQLFYSIITNENSQLRKFHNLANSVIILDEVQTLPYKYWKVTNVIFSKLSEIFNCRIIFLTATMPLIFEEKEKNVIPLIPNDSRNKFFTYFNRYKIIPLNNLNETMLDELSEIAINDINKNKDKSFLFIFNTIKSSVNFYKLLKTKLKDNNKELIYLSSNVLPFERKQRLEKIKNNPNNKIIVSTQVVEAGVDIDIDIVYRDFAPLDSIIQSAGRCNRNNKRNQGIVKLFNLKNDVNSKSDHLYIYKGLTIDTTKEIFKEKNEFHENDILTIINKYYQKLNQYSSNNESNSLLKSLKQLEYTEISKKFKLIEEIPSSLFFLEFNEIASTLLKKFYNLANIDNIFEKNSEFLKIKSQFYEFVLSVKINKHTQSIINGFDETYGFKIIDKEILDSIYDQETGIKYEYSAFL